MNLLLHCIEPKVKQLQFAFASALLFSQVIATTYILINIFFIIYNAKQPILGYKLKNKKQNFN